MCSPLTFPVPSPWQKPIVAIGNFDGVHEGHRLLLAHASKLGGPLLALTFEPHPREVLQTQKVTRLMTPAQKIGVLLTLTDGVAVLPFTPDVSFWAPQEFIERVLTGWLGASWVVVGENFRFGHKAAGDVALLKSQTAFETLMVPLQTDANGQPFSSTRLRESI